MSSGPTTRRVSLGAVLAAIIGAVATLLAPIVSSRFSKSPAERPIYQDAIHNAGVNNGVQIAGHHNQVINNINQARASSHPVTSDMGLKWTIDDFAETVRNGNLPAIREYLDSNDGFDPNSVWNGNIFVLELPIFEGTKNFTDILQLFKQTGKLDWKSINERSIWSGVYGHPITLQYSVLQQAANKHRAADLKSLIAAGADPTDLLADEAKAFHTISRQGIFKGALTGLPTDMRGAGIELDLATFREIGYPLPGLREGPTADERADAARRAETCKQDIRSYHPLKQLIENPPSANDLTWQPYQVASSYLQLRLMQGGWRSDNVEYNEAIQKACTAAKSTE